MPLCVKYLYHPDRLRQLQTSMRWKLIEALNEPEKNQLQYIQHATTYWCDGNLKAVARYRFHLSSKDIVKKEASLAATDRMLVNVLVFTKQVAKELKITGALKPHFNCGRTECSRCPIDLCSDVLQALEQSQKELRGLCLECERSETPPEAGAVCQHIFDR